MDPLLANEITSRTERSRKLLVALENDARSQVPELATSVGFVLRLLDGLRTLVDRSASNKGGEELGYGPDTCDMAALATVSKNAAHRWLGMAQSVSESVCKLVELASARTSETEFCLLRERVGLVAGYLYSDVKEPLWAAFPELVPPEMNQVIPTNDGDIK